MSVRTDASIDGVSTRAASRPISWPVLVIIFFAGNILLWADRSNFSVATAVWAKDYHWTPSTIGMMLSAFSLGYLLMQPFGGWLADRMGPRRTFPISMAGWSLWVFLTPVAPAILWLTATFRVLLGASEAPYNSAVTVAVAKAVPAVTRRGRFNAFIQSGAQFGPAAGVFFAGAILSLTGSAATIFFVFGAVGWLFAGLWWLYARRHEDPAPTGDQAGTSEAAERAGQAVVPTTKLITSKRLWPLYIGYFALPYCQFLFLAWLPQYLAHYRHLSLTNASFLSAFPFIVAFVAANIGGLLMDWFAAMGWQRGGFHRKFLVGVGALMFVSTVLVAANTSSTMLAVYMLAVANAGLAFYVYPFWTTISDIAPKQSGTVSGLMNFCGILGATISPFLSGVIAQATGAFVAPLELAAVIIVVSAATFIVFMQIRPLSELCAA